MARHKTGQMTLAGVLVMMFGASLFSTGVWIINAWVRRTMMGSGLFFLSVAAVYFFMSSLDPARTHSLLSQWQDLFKQIYLMTVGRIGYMMLKSSAKDVETTQEKRLMKILKMNATCEIGEKYNFTTINDVHRFRKVVPLSTYSNISPLMEVVRQGYQMVTTAYRVTEVVRGSANGEEYYFPVTDALKQDIQSISVLLDFQRRRMRTYDQARSVLVDIKTEIDPTKEGVPVIDGNSLLTSFMSSSLIPDECYALPVELQYYAHALIALSENQIKSLEFSSVEVMEEFFKVIMENSAQLSLDVKRAHVTKDLGYSARMRSLIDGRLVPGKGRHLVVKRAVETGEENLALKLWMDLRFVCVRGGLWRKPNDLAMAALKDVTWERSAHVTSGAIIGYSVGNYDPPKYAFALTNTFFEFIEISENSDTESDGGDACTLLLNQVVEGARYEVVVTTNSGLYRYRTGVVVQIAGNWLECPMYVRLE